MKKFLFILAAAATMTTACKKNEGPDTTTSTLRIALSYANTDYGTKLDQQEVTLRLRSLLNGSESEIKHLPGTIEMPSIAPGTYDVQATVTIDRDRFHDLTGEILGSASITFNASAKNLSINEDTDLELALVAGPAGEFVIKQIYYAGSDTKDGALYRDQFIEIYNNTDQVLYADSLYFGRLWGRQSNKANANYHYLDGGSGQLDWSKSKDMTMGEDANTKYAYVRDLHMIPGNGKTYPVQPGESIVIAQNALNHKAAYTGTDGKAVSVKDPSLTVDLSGADFEAYYGDVEGVNPLPSDIDNPAVPNVDVITYSGRDMILDNPGRDSYFIFKGRTRADVTALPEYYEPLTKEPDANKKKYRQLPLSWIMDGVDVQPSVASGAIPKKLPSAVDAGTTFTANGSYSSEAVIRKTASVENGRKILQDTNNSSEDFVSIKADPRGFAD